MVVKLPDAAGDYKFYKDRSYQIDKATSRKPAGMTLSEADLDRTVIVTDPKNPGVIKEQYNLYDEVKDFYSKGRSGNEFGANNRIQYSLFMQCQAEADADHNGVFSEEEYAVFKDKLRAKNLGIIPNCATIEGLYPKQEIVKTPNNLDQNI